MPLSSTSMPSWSRLVAQHHPLQLPPQSPAVVPCTRDSSTEPGCVAALWPYSCHHEGVWMLIILLGDKCTSHSCARCQTLNFSVCGSKCSVSLLDLEAWSQARSYDEASKSPLGWYIRNAQTRQLSHPLPVMRAREIDLWSQSSQYKALLAKNGIVSK